MNTSHRPKFRQAFFRLMVLISLSAPFATASLILVSDDFESGNPGYFRNGAAALVSVTDDSSGIGTNNALLHDPNGNTFRKLVRTFSAFTLAETGDFLELTFDMRFPSGAPTENSQGFRFGLYNSNGTLPTADGQNLTGDDFGFYAALGTGGTEGRFIFETEANGFLGGGTQNQLSGAGGITINDADTQNIVFRLERVATGLEIDLSLNGASILSVIDTSPVTYTFDQIGVGLGNVSSANDAYLSDNVQLTAIPEPSSLMLVMIALVGGLSLFRNKHK